MLLTLVILAFLILAVALLALVERYEWAHDKRAADDHRKKPVKLAYYDAFSERRQHAQAGRAGPESERRHQSA